MINVQVFSGQEDLIAHALVVWGVATDTGENGVFHLDLAETY